MRKKERYALISVYDKKKLEQIAKIFEKANIHIIATGGTASFLWSKKIKVIDIEKITHVGEKFDGRIKTVSFELLAGILFDRNQEKHNTEAEELHVPQIDFVVCNFYPFWENPTIEMIDIGGPTIVRAGAKNFEVVTVLTDPADYSIVEQEISEFSNTKKTTRKWLAAKAFQYVLAYDNYINAYFQKVGKGDGQTHIVVMTKGKKLRYGENPHQKGFFFQDMEEEDALRLGNFTILQGKDPSFNNYLDISSGIELISLIGARDPACVIIKHTNPSGAAIGRDLEDAFKKAWFDGDSLAAFGGIVVFNREVSGKLAKAMLSDKKFFEMVAAPSFDRDARGEFANKEKLQLWENSSLKNPILNKYEDIKKIRGGYLVQDGDTREIKEKDFRVVTKKKPTKEQVEDLIFASRIAQVCKSNAVVAVKNKTLISSGVGQQDRKRCCQLCVSKATGTLKGAVAATDGFFPFRDGPDILIKAGIAAIAQPGGSIRDQEAIDACNEQGVSMVFTNVRGFKH